MAGGRPSKYTDELADNLCDRIANSERGVSVICREDDDMPSYTTVKNWLLDQNKKEFLAKYEIAKELQGEFMAHNMLHIADDNSKDVRINPDGVEMVESENIQRSRLRVDTRKWLLSKLIPKKYGDKTQNEHSGFIGIQTITGMEIK